MSQDVSKATGLAFAVLAFLCWGLLSPGNEIMLREVGPLWMQVLRMVPGALLLVLAAALRTGARTRAGPGPETDVGPTGDLRAAGRLLRSRGFLLALLLGQGIAFTCFIYAQTRIEASFTTLGFYTAPIWTAMLARPLLGERLGRAFGPAVVVLLAGGWLALAGGFTVPSLDAFGVVLAVGSGAAWGGYSVLLRRHAPAVGLLPILVATFVFAAVYFLAAALAFEPMPVWRDLSATTWRWAAIQLAVPTMASLFLFNAALQRAPASGVNLLVGLELAGTMVFAAWLLDARFTLVQLVGVALTLVAVTGYLAWQARR